MAVRVVTGSGKALQSYDQWKESKTSSEPKQVVTSSGKSLQTYDEWKNKKNEESFASIDDDYFSSFLRDSQEFLKQNRQNAFQMTYASSRNRDDQSKMMEQWKSLSDQAKNIRDFLKRNQNSEGWNEGLKDLLDYTESFDGESWDIYSGYEQNYRYYDQFKSENDYNWHEKYKETGSDDLLKALEGLEDGDEKTWLKNYADEVYNRELPEVDVEASRSKAASMQQLLDAYRQNKRFSTDVRGQEWLKEIQPMLDQYGGEEGLEQAISRENQRANLAERVQELLKKQDKFKAVRGNADFATKSAYDPANTDIGYRYVNGDSWDRFLLEQQNGQYVEEFGYHAFDSLTDEEKAVYNYYMNTGDRQSAAEYLDYLQETLNQRKGQQTFEDGYRGHWLPEMVHGWEAGLDQYRSSIEGLGNMIRGESGYVAPSATQYASGLIREDLAETGPKLPEFLGGASVGQAAYDAVTTSANMAPSILASTVIGMVNPAVGAAVGQGMMGAGAAGSAYQEMVNAGYSTDQARLYGAAVGAAEIAMEKLLGGVSKLGGGAIKQITKWASNVDGALANVAIRLAGAAGSEGLEEGLQEIVSGWIKSEITKENFYAQPADVIYSSLLGAVTGGLFEGSDIIGDTAVQSKQGREVLKAEGVEQLKALGKDAADADVRERAEKITDKTKAFGVGGLYRQVEADITKRNAQEIAESLTKKGMDAKSAEQYGETLSYMLENGSATEIQRAVMESDPVVGQTLREIQMPGSGVQKRALALRMATGKAKTIEQVAALYGKQAEAVKKAYIEGQDVEEFHYGFQRVFTVGQEGGNVETLEKVAPNLAASQRKIAYDMGKKAAADQKADAESVKKEASDVYILNEDGSMGEKVRIAEVMAIDGEKMTFRLEDGRTVTDDDLSFSGGQQLLSTAWDMELDVAATNAVLQAGRNSGISEAAMIEGMEESFRYGKYGYDESRLAGTEAGKQIPEQVRKAAYEAGKMQASKESRSAPEKVTPSREKGKVHFDGDREKLNKVQKTSLEGLEWIAEVTGAQIYVEDLSSKDGALGDKNGWYDSKDDSIHIDLRAGRDGTGTLLYTAAHEFVHRMKQNSPARFRKLAAFLVEEYVKHGVDVDALVKEQQRQALNAENGLSYDEAYEEMVADAMEAMFTDSKAAEKLGRLKGQDKSLWQEIKDFVQGLAEKIRRVYAGLKPDSAEARYVLKMKDSIDRLAELFAEGVMDAGAEKNTTGDGGVKYQARRSTRITMHMTDSERTEILKDKVITAEVYAGQADNSIGTERQNLTSYRDSLVKAALVKIGEEFGVFTDYNIADVNVDIRLSRSNLKESISKNIDPIAIAKLLPTLKTAVENAVGIECHANRYFYDNDTVMFENLLGGYVEDKKFIPIRFGLKHSVTGKATLYLIVDQEGIDIKKTKAEVTKTTGVQTARSKVSRSAFNISIASVVPFVNGKDLLRYLPDGMLNVQQKAAKYEAIAETVIYTNDKNDRKYIGFIRSGNLRAANNMVTAAARAAGYMDLYYHGAKKGGGFTKFRDWAYFTQNKGYAERYMQRDNPDSLYTVYVKMENTFDTRNAETEELFAEIRDEYGLGEIQDSGLPDWTDGYDIADYIDENLLEYDSIVLDEGGDLVNGKPVSRGLSYVVRKSEQIKSADVITYDDDGNIIPISRRFDRSNPDIRYSTRKKQPSLEAQNKKLQEDVDRLRELLKLQGKVTKGAKFKASSVEAAARYLKSKFNIGGETKELAKALNGFYEYIATDKELTWENVKEQAATIVDWLLENEKFQRSQYAQDILDSMKGRRFALDEKQRAEAEYQHGSYSAYQKLTRGMVSSNAHTSLDSFWQEMVAEHPGIFDPDISSSDMPQALLDVLERLEGMEDTDFAMDWRMKEQDMLQEVYDSYWRVDNLHTVADRNQKQINELKGRHIQKMNELRQDHAREVQKLKAARKLSEEKHRDSRNKKDLRTKIQKDIHELDKILNRGSKHRNVKQGMQDFARAALAAGDRLFAEYESDRDLIRSGIQITLRESEQKLLDQTLALMEQESNLTGYENLEARRKIGQQISRNIRSLREVLQVERAERNRATVDPLFDSLVDAYAGFAESELGYIQNAYDEPTLNYLKWMKDEIKGTAVKDMTVEQLETLHKAYMLVMNKIRNANKAFVDGRSIQAEAEKIVQEFQSRKIPQKTVGVVLKNLSDAVGWNYEKLYYALDRINSPTLSRLFGALADSENITMRDVQEAKAFQEEMVDKYHYNDWKIDQKIDHDFLDNTGKPFHLTLGELLALYAYSRRDGADTHIEVGGFTFGKTALTNPKPADTYKLTADQVEAVTGMLTPEQKAFAEAMQKYLSETMGGKGNEVSMKLYGIEMFGEENYFPLHIAGEYKARAQESQAKAEAGFQTMSNAGFTKARNKNSTAPIVLEDFMTVWADHVNEMSRYHGAVPALEDIRRVMNYSVYSEADSSSVSVKAAMTNAYGKKAVEYFDELYREANSGAITDKMDAVPKKLLSLFRKNAVAYSLSVVIQQPASIYRARALVDRKYFGKHGFFSLTGGVLRIANRKKWNASYAEMMKYAPGVTMAKEIGGFDTSTGGSIRSYLLDTDKSFRQSMKTGTGMQKAGAVLEVVDDNLIANLPNVADKIAWIEMWEACKRETVAKNRSLSTGSEAFLQKVGERFTEVIRATQVYDSMFSKSPMLKSKNLFVQSMVSFMNEPNTVANMAEAAIRDLSRGNLRQAGKAAAALVTSIAVTNILKSLVYAMRDDDEDETFQEKYVSTIVGNLISDVNPLNYIPFARDAWSVWQGYDVERSDMAIVSDAINAIRQLKEIAGEDLTGMTEEALEEWDKKVTEASWAVAENLSPLFGIPLKNIRRDILAVINTVNIAKLDKTRDTTSLSRRHAIEEAVFNNQLYSGKSHADKLYEAVTAGDEEYIKRLKSGYDDDSSYSNALRRALREHDPRIQQAAQAHFNGDFLEYDRLKTEIAEEGKFDYIDIHNAVKSEITKLEEAAKGDNVEQEEKKDPAKYTAGEYYRSLRDGNQKAAEAIYDYLYQKELEEGYLRHQAESNVKSYLASQIKGAYMDEEISRADALKLLQDHTDKTETDVKKWDFELDTGYAWGSRARGYYRKEISESELVTAVMDIEGESREDALAYIDFLDLAKANEDIEITAAQAKSYFEHAQPTNISAKTYLDYKSSVSGIQNDVDENGESIKYSAVKKIMAIIDSLPLSSSQKTALAQSQGWKEQTIRDYKLWD